MTNSFSDYICKDPSLEVNIKKSEKIFFGYDEKLFTQSQDGSYKFYYKYSYCQGKFMQLTKNQKLEEKPIDINLIPTYDILCLNLAVEKLQNQNLLNRTNLLQKLKERIDKAKENISKTGEAFYKLDDSNFQKEKRNGQIPIPTLEKKKVTNIEHKNFGKVKKRRVTGKTYIFFGAREASGNNRNIPPKFGYVCFREDDKVFYYEKGKLNEKKSLSNFPSIYPLEDLIAFILLRRMITSDNKFAEKVFADEIYNQATARIKSLKTQKFPEKMLVSQSPSEYKNIPVKPLIKNQQSILPRSQTAINSLIATINSF